jgi:hypothetical protein
MRFSIRFALLSAFAIFSCQTQAQDKPVAKPEAKPESLTHQVYKDAKLKRLEIHDNPDVVDILVFQRNIPITYDYVASLMRTPNAFGNGPACIVCHSSNDPTKSYRGLDLSSCKGMMKGATEAPVRPVVVPGKPDESLIAQMLRNNRMPLGVSFFQPIETDNINTIREWIDKGAKNDEFFAKKVMPLFTNPTAFGGAAACTDCHSSFRDPPSFNEVNLTSHEAILKGAFSRTLGKENKPGIPIVVPGNSSQSRLLQRLTMNRMPPGINPGDEGNHPNILLLRRWIEHGAQCSE